MWSQEKTETTVTRQRMVLRRVTGQGSDPNLSLLCDFRQVVLVIVITVITPCTQTFTVLGIDPQHLLLHPQQVKKGKTQFPFWEAQDLVWRQGKHTSKTSRLVQIQARAWAVGELWAMTGPAGMQDWWGRGEPELLRGCMQWEGAWWGCRGLQLCSMGARPRRLQVAGILENLRDDSPSNTRPQGNALSEKLDGFLKMARKKMALLIYRKVTESSKI